MRKKWQSKKEKERKSVFEPDGVGDCGGCGDGLEMVEIELVVVI